MKKFNLMFAALLIIVACIAGNTAFATSEVESKEEMLGYIRVLFSDRKVVQAYETLLKDGYLWTDELGNFGSMHDEHPELELFTGQVQIIMRKKSGVDRRAKEKNYKQLTITFTWSRKSGKITKTDSIEY
jgi:hypothetical protein